LKINKGAILFYFLSVFYLQSFSQCSLLDLPFNGNANDVSGNFRHGTVHGAILATDRFGNNNSAYWFDGVDDYISVDTSGLKNNIYSFSLWTKLSSQPISRDAYIAISIGQSGGDQQIIYMTDDQFQTYGWGCSSYALGAPHDTDMGRHTDLTNWHHLVTTRNNNELKLYFDGDLFGEIPIGGKPADYARRAQVGIGARWGQIQFFHGFIDDVNIYGCELTPEEVRKQFLGDEINPEKEEPTIPSFDNYCTTIRAYPNPTFSNVTIQLCDTMENVSYQFESINGQLIKQDFIGESAEIKFNLTQLAGVYIFKVYSNNVFINRIKIIKI